MLHIFDALSSNDIRFQSVDVSSPLSGANSSSQADASSLPQSLSTPASVQEKNVKTRRWREIVERERDKQGEWRKLLVQSLFSGTAHDNVPLELPQIWVVTENGPNDGTPESKDPLRLPICKVRSCA